MFLAYHVGIQDTGSRFKRIHGRIYAQFSNLSAENGGRVQMAERRGRSRVSEVISRNIYSLDRCYGSVLCGGDTLLHLTHFGCQRRLISHGRRHAAQKGRHLGARLGETEDVVYEEQDILRVVRILAVSERLRQGQT